MSLVLVRNADYDSAGSVLTEIFQRLDVNLQGKSVLLKPNFGAAVGPEKSAATDPRLVKALLDQCLKQTSDVAIGDNPGNLDEGAMHSVRMSGILDLAPDHYCNISREGEFVDIGSAILPRVFVSRKVRQVDFLINVPKMKTHVLSGISCCIKNLFGYVVGAMKSRYHLETGNLKRLTQLWLDLYKWRTPDLHVVDAVVGMEGGGPTHGKPRKVGKIVAGKNGVEVDAVITAMMGWDPTKIKMLEMAHQQGLGEIRLDRIDVEGDFEVLPTFERPPTFALESGFNPYEQIVKIQPVLDEGKCVLCRLCGDQSCPAGAISFDPWPKVDSAKCIACYCCVEFCPEGALSVPYRRDLMEVV